MKPDIEGRAELEQLVDSFYNKVRNDDLLGPLFARVNWEYHLPVMYSFWENALFYSGGYAGNPLRTHQNFHKRMPLNEAHFSCWLQIFNNTVDELFEGANAVMVKQKAKNIATVMQLKIFSSL